MVTTIEYGQGCIVLAIVGVNEGTDEVAQSHTLVCYRTIVNVVLEQTYAVVVLSINAPQVVAIFFGSIFSEFLGCCP